MSLENRLENIKRFLKERYKDNLAAILIFGSANTGHFKEEESDIDHMIFLKRLDGLDLNKESKFLFEKLKSENFATQYFNTLKGIKEYLKRRKSFSTYITIVSEDGSRTLYTTPEFERTREYLRKHPFTKNEIQEFIKKKDRFELQGYFRKIKRYNLTKALMAHLRRKLQVMNYFKRKKLIFDYEKCFNNINLVNDEKRKLERLYKSYEKRKSLSKREVQEYYKLAEELTKRILKI